MRFKGVRERIPFLLVVGFAIVLVGCPKKAPPVKPAEPANPKEVSVSRAEVPKPPPVPPAAPKVDVEGANTRRARELQGAMRAFESELVHFAFDRSEIQGGSKSVLARKANFLRRFGNVRIQIEGHCDDRGSIQYNLALGDRRANSAKTYLVALGIAANRISTISFGEERPMARASNEAAWAKNRRAKFVVIGQ
jgi:peptidoglycan-associated lipoprotein